MYFLHYYCSCILDVNQYTTYSTSWSTSDSLTNDNRPIYTLAQRIVQMMQAYGNA